MSITDASALVDARALLVAIRAARDLLKVAMATGTTAEIASAKGQLRGLTKRWEATPLWIRNRVERTDLQAAVAFVEHCLDRGDPLEERNISRLFNFAERYAMTPFTRHISAAVSELADTSLQYSAGDTTMAGTCLANALLDLAVCARELADRGARPVIAKSLALQLRRIANQLDPEEARAAQ